jgi:hypothetical protein
VTRRKPLAPERQESRSGPSRSSRKRFLVVCEGRLTEPEYIKYVKRQLRDSLLDIKVLGGYTDPMSLVRTAMEHKATAERNSRLRSDAFLRYDGVWCLVDKDEHAKMPEARSLAQRNGIRLILSNPCFELWLLLHFVEKNAYMTSKEAAKLLGAFMVDYEKNPSCNLLIGHYLAARARAKKLCNSEGCRGDSNPSTHVWELVDAVLESARRSSANASSFSVPL